MKKIIGFICIVAFTAAMISCQSDPDPGGTNVQDMAGEWWVHYEAETSPGVFEDVYGLGYLKLMTFNTAANNDSIWIDDLEHFVAPFKVKAAANPSSKTITSDGSLSIVPYDEDEDENPLYSTVKVTNGKVLSGQGKSVSGVSTDSIYLEIELDIDPGTIYRVSGHRRTGFLEDELE